MKIPNSYTTHQMLAWIDGILAAGKDVETLTIDAVQAAAISHSDILAFCTAVKTRGARSIIIDLTLDP